MNPLVTLLLGFFLIGLSWGITYSLCCFLQCGGQEWLDKMLDKLFGEPRNPFK